MSKQRSTGFTLVEAALCCLVLAILVGLAVPQLERSLSLFRLEAAADLVATELAAGRMLAVSRNWLYEMDCNTTNNTIQVIDPNNSNNHPRLDRGAPTNPALSTAYRRVWGQFLKPTAPCVLHFSVRAAGS